MGGPIIRTEGVRKSFGDVHALTGVDLEVSQGAVFGLLGPNGAGKTTTVRILTTLLPLDSGTAEVTGLDVVKHAEALRFRIGLAGQFAAVDDNLTGLESLMLVGMLYHLSRAEAKRRGGETLERFDLSDAADRPARTYSGGMRRRLDVAASLVGRPEVLFLDEPTTGLDPRSRADVWEFIRELQADGTTLLLTTQYLEVAEEDLHGSAPLPAGAHERDRVVVGEALRLGQHVEPPLQRRRVPPSRRLVEERSQRRRVAPREAGEAVGRDAQPLRLADEVFMSSTLQEVLAITAIDGQPVKVFDDLLAYLSRYGQPGGAVTLSLIRDGEAVDIEVILEPRPSALGDE